MSDSMSVPHVYTYMCVLQVHLVFAKVGKGCQIPKTGGTDDYVGAGN